MDRRSQALIAIVHNFQWSIVPLAIPKFAVACGWPRQRTQLSWGDKLRDTIGKISRNMFIM